MDKMYKKRYDGAVRFATRSSGLKQYNLTWWQDESKQWPLFPLAIEETIRITKRSTFNMKHEWLMIALMLKGSHTYKFDSSNEIILNEGDICIIPPDCEYTCQSKNGYHKFVMMVDGVLLKENCRIFNMTVPVKSTLSLPEKMETIFRQMALLMDDGQKKRTADVLSLLQKLLVDLSILFATRDLSANHKLYINIQHFLSCNFDRKIKIKDLASAFNVSSSFVQKLFRKYSTLSPMQYRITQKLERACYLLTYSDQSIKEISFQIGYENQHYFANDFKKHYNMTPTKYRKL